MAMQAGVSTSKVLILAGAGLTSSIILRNGRLSELIAQLQELLKGVDEVEIASYKYDSALLAAQIRQLAQEIKELTLSNPVTIFNGNASSSGSFASYLVPAAALGAMGYCYMWWKGLSFSDVMFVTKQNMASAVASVSKQLENVSETLASTKRHLTKRLENLDWKVVEQIETSKLIANDLLPLPSTHTQSHLSFSQSRQSLSGWNPNACIDGREVGRGVQFVRRCLQVEAFVSPWHYKGSSMQPFGFQEFIENMMQGIVDEMKTNLSQIGYDVEIIHQMISGLEGKLELLENKQDATNSGLWYLCQFAGGFKDGPGAKIQQELGFKLANYSAVTYEDMSTKGLRFIAEAKELDTSDKSMEHMKKNDLDIVPGEKIKPMKTRIHRSYPVGLSLARDLIGSGV